MYDKHYCFIPETYKIISVYNPGSINSSSLTDAPPSTTFKYCIDDYDKARLFYISKQSDINSIDDEEYFKYKTIQYIKSIFKISELIDYKLFLEDDARVEFTALYDVNGNNILLKDAKNKNQSNTLIGHRYIYNFFKRYN